MKVLLVTVYFPPAGGGGVQRPLGIPWIADLRDSLVAHPHRRTETLGARAKARSHVLVARMVAHRADAIVAAADAIAHEARGLSPKGRVVTIENGCDFDDF